MRAAPFAALLAAVLLVAAAAGASALEVKATAGHCRLEGTDVNDAPLNGSMTFTLLENGNLNVTYEVLGLDDGDHPFHVHNYGDLHGVAVDGKSVGGHFVGDCTACRTDNGGADDQEVGRLGDNHMISSAGRRASGHFEETVAKLNGPNSVVGHSIVIHGLGGDNGKRVAVCVIGGEFDDAEAAAEEEAVPAQQASCRLSATGQADGLSVNGLVRFVPNSDGHLDVVYFVSEVSNQTEAVTLLLRSAGNVADDEAAALTGTTVQTIGGDGTSRAVGPHGRVGGVIVDSALALSGPDSIIGRAVVLVRSGLANTPLAQCVVGVTRFSEPDPAGDGSGEEPLVLRAEAALLPASAPSDAAERAPSGLVQVDYDAEGRVRVRYALAGMPADAALQWSVRTPGRECPLAGDSADDMFGPALAGTNATALAGHTPVANAAGEAAGSVLLDSAVLNGDASWIGRTVLVARADDGAVLAYGALGVAQEHPTATFAARPRAVRAGCRLRPSALAGDHNVTGLAGFVSLGVQSDNVLEVRHSLGGLVPGAGYTWHIHSWGRTLDYSLAQAVGGHFIGTCNDTTCRPDAAKQEIGMLNDGATLVSSAQGTNYGSYLDGVVKTTGVDSVVGRSIIVHAPGGARVAQCVIGVEEENDATAPSVAEGTTCPGVLDENNFERRVEVAVCALRGEGGVSARVRLRRLPEDAAADVDVLSLTGLNATLNYSLAVTSRGDVPFGSSMSSLDAFGEVVATVANGTLAGGVATSGYTHDLELAGWNSVVGRSMVVYSTGEDGVRVPHASCVIGVAEEERSRRGRPLTARRPRVKRAAANLVSTSEKELDEGAFPAGGRVEFVSPDVDAPAGNLGVRVHVWGLKDGLHVVIVTSKGDLTDDSGASIGGPLSGACQECGAPVAVDPVGQMVHPYYEVRVSGGWGTGYLTAKDLGLWGRRSAVGLGVAVRGAVDTSAVVLQGVVGVAHESETEPMPPYVELNEEEDPDDFDVDGGPVDDEQDDDEAMDEPAVETGVPYVVAASARLAATDAAPEPAIDGHSAGGVVNFELDYANGHVEVSYALSGLAASTEYRLAVNTLGNLCGGDGNDTGDVLDRQCFDADDDEEPCRDGDKKLGDFYGSPFTTDAYGMAVGSFVDARFQLDDALSVVGRSVVLTAADDAAAVAAVGVVGRTRELWQARQKPAPAAGHASCRLVPTHAAVEAGFANLTGYVAMTQGPTAPGVRVEYYLTGAEDAPGEHSYEVASYGAMDDQQDGLAVGDLFVGEGPLNRRTSGPEAIGSVNNGRGLLVTAGGASYDSFRDPHLSLHGANSVVGRAFVVRGFGGDDDAVLAQCVVGYVTEGLTRLPFPECEERLENPRQAVCAVAGTDGNPDVSGSLSIVRLAENDYSVSWQVDGLLVGDHAVSVRRWGNVFAGDASMTGDEFFDLNVTMSAPAPGEAASGAVSSATVVLRGNNSLVGRSLVVHAGDSRDSTPVAQCVIGRADLETVDPEPVDGQVNARQARADLQSLDGEARGGWMTFEDLGDKGVAVRYFVWGMEGTFDHDTHVHTRGDLRDPTGADVGPHFLGSCEGAATPCREEPALPEVGYLGDGYRIKLNSRTSQGYFVDKLIKLSGPDSVLGRSVVVHGSLDAEGSMVLSGVIGVVAEGEAPAQPAPAGGNQAGQPAQVTAATALVRETSEFIDTTGVFHVEQVEGNATRVRVTYTIFGLLPGEHDFAVHQAGDLCLDDATSVGAAASPALGTGRLIVGADAEAHGSFETDAGFRLHGDESVVGHALVVYGVAGDASARAAVGVFGRAREHANNTMPDVKEFKYASCRLEPTWNLVSSAAARDALSGYVFFEDLGGDKGVRVQYQVYTADKETPDHLPEGPNNWHVHTFGDLTGRTDGAATGGHFVGDCDGCRPDGALQEIGLINDGTPLVASAYGTASGNFVDDKLRLNGVNGIVGRAVIIHQGTGAPRLAQCVIGGIESKPEEVCPLLVQHDDPKDEDGSSSSSGVSTETIAIAATAGGVGALVIALVVFVCCCNKKRGKAAPQKMAEHTASTRDMELGAVAGSSTAAAGAAANTTTTGATVPPGAVPGGSTSANGVYLPPGWEEHEDDEGQLYYYNVSSQQSVWTAEEMYTGGTA